MIHYNTIHKHQVTVKPYNTVSILWILLSHMLGHPVIKFWIQIQTCSYSMSWESWVYSKGIQHLLEPKVWAQNLTSLPCQTIWPWHKAHAALFSSTERQIESKKKKLLWVDWASVVPCSYGLVSLRVWDSNAGPSPLLTIKGLFYNGPRLPQWTNEDLGIDGQNYWGDRGRVKRSGWSDD